MPPVLRTGLRRRGVAATGPDTIRTIRTRVRQTESGGADDAAFRPGTVRTAGAGGTCGDGGVAATGDVLAVFREAQAAVWVMPTAVEAAGPVVPAIRTAVRDARTVVGAGYTAVRAVRTGVRPARRAAHPPAACQAAGFRKQAEQCTEARDRALGIASAKTEEGTALFTVLAARDVLLGLHKGREHRLGDWGFEVDASPRAKAKPATAKP